MENMLEKFLEYISIDTCSDPWSDSQPSAQKELILLEKLNKELNGLGVRSKIDEYGYVMAKIPGNCDKSIPAIGFIAHADTSPDALGANITPQIIENYNGGDINLNGVPGLILSPKEFPELADYIGQTVITTDGTTLLGADDKAGIAEIMEAVRYIVKHPEFKHGDICIGFTPDEEIGRGVVKFDVKEFGADFAYTIDGGKIGELEYENFNAASATISIQGRNIHPGEAKGKMKNASLIAMEFNSMLPCEQRPENTCDYQGFFHLTDINGNVENAELSYIIRDHDTKLFEEKKSILYSIAEKLNKKYGENTIEIALQDQYHNMKEMIEPHMHIVDIAKQAMLDAGIRPIIRPIRGGTDGANLSFMGLPCPNIFAGGHNFHGKMEYIPYESMEKAVETILGIIRIYAERIIS